MRRIEIVEIENSYLNFFTPAIIVAASYFLFNLVGWPVLFIENILLTNSDETTMIIISTILSIFTFSIVSILIYLVSTSKFKIREAEFKKINLQSLLISIITFFIITGVYFLIIKGFYIIILPQETEIIPLLSSAFDNPIYTYLAFFENVIITAFFFEIIFRRIMIPLLEDRGCSPFLSVILAAIGSLTIDIPLFGILMYRNSLIIHDIFIKEIGNFLIGISLGFIYISTRNIFFCYLSQIFFISHEFIREYGNFIQSRSFLYVYDIINILGILIGIVLVVYIIIKVLKRESVLNLFDNLKKKSAPKINRGIIGFFIISIGLLLIQMVVVIIGRLITNDVIFPDYFIYIMIFYFIAFTIPFWLTINTEYALDS